MYCCVELKDRLSWALQLSQTVSKSNICCKFELHCIASCVGESALWEERSARQQSNEENVRAVSNFDEAAAVPAEWCQIASDVLRYWVRGEIGAKC